MLNEAIATVRKARYIHNSLSLSPYIYIRIYKINCTHREIKLLLIDRSDLCRANSWEFGESHGYMHFQKLELQLSNALGFRLGDLLPVEALVFYVFFCAQLYYYTWWWCGWLMKSSSRYNLVHLLPTSSSKSAPRPTVLLTFSSGNWALATVSRTFCRSAPTIFFTICMWNRALATVLCILSTSSSKSAPRPPVFYDCRALATVLCTFCLPFSPIEPRTRGNRDPPSATTAASLPEKNTGFCARECFQAWIDAFPISHASQLLACVCHDDWGDDVVAIMVRKLAMTIVRNSEVS